MIRILVEAKFPAGSIGLIHPVMDLDAVDWTEFIVPVAEMLAVAHPEAEWTARLLDEDETEKGALLGY